MTRTKKDSTLTFRSLDKDEAEKACRHLIEDLPDYFGLPEVNEQYARGVRSRENFGAWFNGKLIALLSLEFPYTSNGNIYFIGVLRSYQRQGAGRQLIQHASSMAQEKGSKTLTVETLAPCEGDENYLKTYAFYESIGFSPLFNLKPQGYEWTMVYMMKEIL